MNKSTIFLCTVMRGLRVELSVSPARQVLYHWVIAPALKASFNNSLSQKYSGAAYLVRWYQMRFPGVYSLVREEEGQANKQRKETAVHCDKCHRGEKTVWGDFSGTGQGNLWGSDIWAEIWMAGRSRPVQTLQAELYCVCVGGGAQRPPEETGLLILKQQHWEDTEWGLSHPWHFPPCKPCCL